MSSLFINAGLAAGVALAAIPVILHMFMKQTPKHVIFPALRLIKKRQERTKKKLRIKNWLLLLARMALLALMALALARPRYNAKIQAGDAQVESAIALVFDTSLSMGYTDPDKSLLDKAKEMAGQLLQRAHASSQVYVIDSARATEPLALTPGAARKAIEALELAPANQSLNQALGLAYGAVGESTKPRREVYVLTDLARTSWGLSQSISNLEKVQREKRNVGTYLINLGPKAGQRHDVAIVAVEPTTGLVGQDEAVPIKVTVRSTGKSARRVVEFSVDGKPREKRPVEIPADSEVQLPPFLPRLSAGQHRVEMRLDGEADPLPINDSYYLTFEVRPASNVLIISDSLDDASYVGNALDPEDWRNRPEKPRPYHVVEMPTNRIEIDALRRSLSSYACVYMINVRSPKTELWQALGDYVRGGGALVIGVGDRVAADVESYNTPPEAKSLLPATLGAVRRHEQFTFGRADVASSLFAMNTQDLLGELSRVPIYKSMAAEPVGDARALLSYQDDSPALLERTIGSEKTGQGGRVLLWTTALARVPQQNLLWNEFPVANWSFVQMMTQTIPYVTGSIGRKLAIEAGESVTLPVDPTARLTDVNARHPGSGKTMHLNDPATGRPLVVATRATNLKAEDMIGQWTVTATRQGEPPLSLGFSVNAPLAESELAPLASSDLDPLLGKKSYRIADSFEGLITEVAIETVGREAFPWLMLALLLLVTGENALANLFYRERTSANSTRTRVPAAARA